MRRAHLWLIAVAAIVPRVIVLVHERRDILTAFTDKSDDFAQTFVKHGTFGLIPGEPSAYTQPLYGFFLVPVYWIFGSDWWSVGFVQILVATATAFLVYAIGARVMSRRAGTVAAVLSTLNPYLVWHDVHLNREILDQLVGAAFVLCALIAADRRSWTWATAAGVCGGLAMLGNVRLLLLPVLVALYLVFRTGWTWAPLALVAAAAVTVTPWVVRNRVEVGCFALTTDGARAVEGEQLADVRPARRGQVDRRRPRPARTSLPQPGGSARHLQAEREEDPRRRVLERELLPAPRA